MEKLIDMVLERHRLAQKIDALIPSCGLTHRRDIPDWHIHGFGNFKKVCDALVEGHFTIEDSGARPYRFKCSFTYRRVYVFCLIEDADEERVRIDSEGRFYIDELDSTN